MSNTTLLRRRAFLAHASAVGAATILGGMTGTPADAAASAPRILFGAWQPGAPWDGSSRSFANIESLEARLSRRLDILHWYAGWAHVARPDLALIRDVYARGALPLITWEPWDYLRGIDQPAYALSRIAAGDFDAYLDTWARDLGSLGAPVYLRFAHEMDGPYYPWSVGQNGNTSTDFIEAWRRVVRRFRAAGADNVRWVW